MDETIGIVTKSEEFVGGAGDGDMYPPLSFCHFSRMTPVEMVSTF